MFIYSKRNLNKHCFFLLDLEKNNSLGGVQVIYSVYARPPINTSNTDYCGEPTVHTILSQLIVLYESAGIQIAFAGSHLLYNYVLTKICCIIRNMPKIDINNA